MNRNIMRWSPWGEIDRVFEEDFWRTSAFSPAMDVYQDKDNVMVETVLPGVDPDKVEISVENDVLTLSGTSEEKREVKNEDYYRKEIRQGSFSRSVILPMTVKADQAEAHYDKGILKITLPKAEEAKPKKITVNVKK